jgi:hypothetical protein
VTFWNEIVVFSDPDRFQKFFIPANVSNLVRFARFEFLSSWQAANQSVCLAPIHFLNHSNPGGILPMRDLNVPIVTHRTGGAAT